MAPTTPPVAQPRATPTGTNLPLAADLTEMLDGRLPGLIGMRVTEASAERVLAELTVREEVLAPNGRLHAATIVALADTACGIGTRLSSPRESRFSTLEIKTNYLGTARTGVVSVVATPAHLGRRTQVWDATVTDENGRTIALFRCTQLVTHP